MKKIGLLVLIVSIVLTSCSSKFTKVMKSKDNEYKYKMAEQYFAKKKYNLAQQLFEDLFPYVKGTPRFEDLYYKYAYAAYYQKDYMNAENLFKSFAETFPTSPKADDAEYMRAYSYYKQSPKVELDQTSTTKTIGLMQAYINQHPNSPKVKEASGIIDEARAKLELKELKAAELYYNLGFYKAAAIAYSTLMENYPDSEKSDDYKLNVIKSYYKYAEMSIPERQEERFEKVLTEVTDFTDRFPESKYLNEVNQYKNLSSTNIKNLKNEQAKKTT
jgi:outer membrane protein assembly factor BamD